MDLPSVEPVFINAKDIIDFKTVKEFEICDAVLSIIQPKDLLAFQRMVWRIYVKDNQARVKLCTTTLNIRGQSVQTHSNNPYRAGIGQGQSDTDVIKITFKDIPLSRGNNDVIAYLDSKNIKLKRPIQYGKVRNERNELTDILNGDRIAFTEPFASPLPRRTIIGSSHCVIFHRGQKRWDKPLCNNCYQEGHFRNQCQNSSACVVCKQPGHSPGDVECPGTAKHKHRCVTPFQGYEDPLSNFYPCQIKVFGVSTSSAEHAYQYSKAVQCGHPDVATEILSAKTALQAKRLSSSLPYNPNWELVKEDQMAQVLEAKAKGSPEFCDTLIQSSSNILVEAVQGDLFWSSGLNKEQVLRVKKNSWPGKNRMGKLLTDLRAKIVKESSSKGRSMRKTQNGGQSQNQDGSESESEYNFSD